MVLSHKIFLSPNNKQRSYFSRASGVRRFAYNWALKESESYYQSTKKSLSAYDLSKRLNSIKHKEFPWMLEVTKWAPQEGVYSFRNALDRFFKKKAKFPKLKKKNRSKDTFFISLPKVVASKVQIPNLGQVKMAQEIRFPGKVVSVRIKREGSRWFACFTVELDSSYVYPNKCETQASVGIDLGIKSNFTFSDGRKVNRPECLASFEAKIRHLSRSLSRKMKGSKNRAKARMKLADAHYRKTCYTHDFLHKITSEIVKNYKLIGIEDLNVRGMMKNHNLARSIQNMLFSETRRELEYKSQLSGSELVLADRWYPSSKTCYECKFINKELTLSDREWICPQCGCVLDRDVNASKNLEAWALSHRAEDACGGDVRPMIQKSRIKGSSCEAGIEHPVQQVIGLSF